MHYYERHPFSEAQALHAAETVLFLIRTKRFFLHDPKKSKIPRSDDDTLDPMVFAEAIALNQSHVEIHQEARQTAVQKILEFEAEHEIVPAVVPKNRSIVDYSRYSRGFEICRVYPLSAFAPYVPGSFDELVGKLIDASVGNKETDDISPREMRNIEDEARKNADLIWKQLQDIDAANPENNRCVVLLRSLSDLNKIDDKGDLASGNVWDMQDFAFALGFLFSEYSKEYRILEHGLAIFSTNIDSHIQMKHFADSSPQRSQVYIRYNASTGYDCTVLFASVL